MLLGLAWGSTFAADWNLPGVTIISRAQRGANESLRYSTLPKSKRDQILQQQKTTELQMLENSDQSTDSSKLWDTLQQNYELQIANDYLLSAFPTEQSVDALYESENGNFLKWPESIHTNKAKIIIHHTADDYTSLLT